MNNDDPIEWWVHRFKQEEFRRRYISEFCDQGDEDKHETFTMSDLHPQAFAGIQQRKMEESHRRQLRTHQVRELRDNTQESISALALIGRVLPGVWVMND